MVRERQCGSVNRLWERGRAGARNAAKAMQNIDLKAVIGFTGDVPGGLVVHPTNKYALYI